MDSDNLRVVGVEDGIWRVQDSNCVLLMQKYFNNWNSYNSKVSFLQSEIKRLNYLELDLKFQVVYIDE